MKTKKCLIAFAIIGGLMFTAFATNTVSQDEQTAGIDKGARRIIASTKIDKGARRIIASTKIDKGARRIIA